MTRTRWIGVSAVLLVAIVVGILYGYVAGVAVVLGVLTVLMLGFSFGWSVGLQGDDPIGRYWEEQGSGPDAAKRRGH